MSILYVKVSVARRPVSGKKRAIRIAASYDEHPTKNSVIWYAELGFDQLSISALDFSVKKLAGDARALVSKVKINKEIQKMM
jgi:hypothetical protein